MFGRPHKTGRHARHIVPVKHNPSAPNNGFSRVGPHREIDCVPFAEHVNLAFDRVAVSRGFE
jgi:hypothetical protein